MPQLPTPGQDAGQWGAMLNAFMQVSHNADGTCANMMANVAVMKALSVTDAAGLGTVYVKGYTTTGDGGEGVFCWDAASTTSDNGGTVFALAAGGTGRWQRQMGAGPVNVKWFGARGDGATDDIVAINRAIQAASLLGVGEVVMSGHFVVSSAILLRIGINLNGTSSGSQGNPGTVISTTANYHGNIIESMYDETDGFAWAWQHWGGISNLCILGDNQLTGCGIKIYRPGENFLITKVQIFRTASHGIMLYDAGTPCHIGLVSAHWCGHRDNGAGLYIQDMIYTSSQVAYLAGDNNKLGLLKVKNLYQSNLYVLNFKAERSDFTTENPLCFVGHDDVIVVENGNGGILTIGNGKVWCQDGVSSPGSIIRNFCDATSATAQIQVLGSIAASIGPTYGTYVNDYQGETTVPYNTFLNTLGVHELGRTDARKGAFSTSGNFKAGSHKISGTGTVATSTTSTDGLAQTVLNGATGGQIYNAGGILYVTQGANQDIVTTLNGVEIKRSTAGGSELVGTNTDVPCSRLTVSSTNRGFLPPRMTSAEKAAIPSPTAGLMVYDTTLNKLCVYTTTWETITST